MPAAPRWVLSSGEMIKVFLHDPDFDLEFRVRIPRRNDEDERDYLANIREHSAWNLLTCPSDPDQSKISLGFTSTTESKRRRSTSLEDGFNDETPSSAVTYPAEALKSPFFQYTIAWICTLHSHLKVATMMLDEVHARLHAGVVDTYIRGSMGQHNVVIACPGTPLNIEQLKLNLLQIFPTIKLLVIVGSGGGVPSRTVDIRLGDVVVGTKAGLYRDDGIIEVDPLQPLADSIVSRFRARHEADNGRRFKSILESQSEKEPDFRRPNLRDRLFKPTYTHSVSEDAPSSRLAGSLPAKSVPPSADRHIPKEASECEYCDESAIVARSMRTTQVPRVHFGGILSSPRIIKDAAFRDKITKGLGTICIDYWEAGRNHDVPWIHIRGICDYSDSHKNKGWQRFAALSAASLAKDLIMDVPLATPLIPDPHRVPADDFPRKRREVLQSFRFETMDTCFSKIGPALDQTCDWLLELPEYQQWLEFRGIEQHHGILWILGKPGVGKSTIMKFAYEKMREQHQPDSSVVASFFFHSSGDDLEKRMFGLYRSLLAQIFEAVPTLETLLDGPHIPWSREDCPCPGPDILKALLKDAVSKLGQRTLTCFIDALDECDSRETEDIGTFLQDLAETAVKGGSRLRICISSRHYPSIYSRTGISVALEALEGHATDLCQYVEQRLRVNGDVDRLRHVIVEKSAGIFVWVVEMVRKLNEMNRRGRPLSLDSLPLVSVWLNDIFRNIFGQDNLHIEEHEACFMWIFCAVRPLGLHEYQHALWSALAMKGYDNDPPPLGYTDELTPAAASKVAFSSKGLAEVTSGVRPTVQFIHETVRAFLIKEEGFVEPLSDGNTNQQGMKHEFIKKCCSFYLSYEASTRGNDQPSPRTRDFALLEYAAHNILHHAECAAEMVDQQEFLAKFDMTKWLEAYSATDNHKTRQYDRSTSLIYVLADRGLPRLIRFWLKANSMTHALHCQTVFESRYGHPILAALASRNKQAVAALLGTSSTVIYGSDMTEGLTHGAPHFSDLRGHTPLTWAAGRGLLGIVQWMLECGVNAAEVDPYGHSALSRACAHARLEVINLLLNQGAHLHRNILYAEKPLVQAARHGHVQVCQMMLAAGFDLNAVDKHRHTALSGACEDGRLEVAEYLLSFGGTPNLADSSYRSPLVEACRSGHYDLVQLLLTHGADVNNHDEHGWTPLKFAADKGHMRILELLIANGANVDYKGPGDPLGSWTASDPLDQLVKSSFTPLMNAIDSRCHDATKLLLACGADVGARSENGLTPLVLAARQRDFHATQLILEAGADINDASEDGYTALMFAAAEADTSLVAHLINHGADVNAVCKAGMSPLVFAANEGHYFTVELLLSAGADPNIALWFAIREDRQGICRLLLGNGADPNVRKSGQMTPLMLAVQNGRDTIVGLLLEAGADVEAVNADGVSALMLAGETGQSATVRRLLDHGTKVSAIAQDSAGIDHPGIEAVLMAHEQDSQLAPTDSGYASTYNTEGKVDDETGTVYSVVSTSRSLDEGNYITELASQLTSGVSLPSLDDKIIEKIVPILPNLLKDFALKVGHGQPIQMERDAMAFVHKHRK